MVYSRLHPILSLKQDELVVAQNLHIVYQPVIEGLSLLAKLLLHPLGQLTHGTLAVNFLPQEAAVFIQLDVADPGRVEELLCNGSIEAPVDHVNGNNTLFILAPIIFGVHDGDEIQIVIVLFFGHIGFSSWIIAQAGLHTKVYSPA